MTEIEARTALDEAIRVYATATDQTPNATVTGWVLLLERSALFPDDPHEPLHFAQAYANAIGLSTATALGMIRSAHRLLEDNAVASYGTDEDDT